MRATLFCLLALGVVACGGKDNDTSPKNPPKECDAYEFNGMTYDCSTLDPCTEEDLTFRLACCDCDPNYCEADPSCTDTDDTDIPFDDAESCMECHNGSSKNDYAGDGLTNPHPFVGAAYIRCTVCHGGDGKGSGKDGSHVPPPPQIGDDLYQSQNPGAWFNRLTLTGIDKLPDYTVNGKTYTALEYLQFINPGDLRVVSQGKSCGTGGCHMGKHAEWVPRGPLATEVGMYSSTLYGFGVENAIPEHRGLHLDNAGDYSFRAVSNPAFNPNTADMGEIGELRELPERAVWGDTTGVYQNPVYDANLLHNYIWTAAEDPYKAGRVKAGTPLETLLHQTIALQCGDCHLGSAGANNRYGDYRSSGCTACHMEYSSDGRSRSTDPNVNKFEPADPDAIAAPERPHIMDHQIRNVQRTLPNGAFIRGISDKVCIGCHQGSNRTVLQYWGVRLDQNQDLHQGTQYPVNPVNFSDATGDTRFFDPAVGNQTFNGRVAEQLIVFEDYDGDGRDDTPEDVHYEAGMGCIDCHSSRDLHNGAEGDPTSGRIVSRMDQTVGIQCESCHGGIEDYASTSTCKDYNGNTANCAVDRFGNPLRHVTRDASGNLWLRSRVTGATHFVPQTKDTVVNNNKRHPITSQALYNPIASYAMGRADGNPLTGTGPVQTNPNLVANGFSHTDDIGCATCHASWTNSCVGCHLALQYDGNPANYNFSNTTGERVATNLLAADFVYQTPVLFTLGVNSRNEISQNPPGMKVFFRYIDFKGDESEVLAFSNRQGAGNNPFTSGRGALPNLAHEQMAAHSIRGKVTATKEGPRYCVTCHLTEEALDNFGAEYDVFRNALENRNYANINFNLLATHIGANPGNQLNSPFFVYQAAGLGTGLFLFDAFGCPVNPLDQRADRQYCQNGAPANNFNLNNVAYDLDKATEITGISNASNSHPLLDGGFSQLRSGSLDPGMSGPMGARLLQRLTDPNTGIVLDSWIDADGVPRGDAANYLQ